MADRRYRAFISYSHRDKAVASWLHRALETYRFPKGKDGAPSAERLHPIFKDREELPAADDLGEVIGQAIASSDALIVLCSPEAAQSPWIAKEVDAYKRLNDDRNVFPVIVSGEPPDNFPAPLLVHYEDGEPTDRKAEPIAADLRTEGDGRKLAKLKLVAGLGGVDLDTLVQRDAARKQRRMAVVVAASLVGMAGTSGLAFYAIDQRNEAREQRAEADGLIEYMLTDLRKQLEPVGRLEVLDGVGKRAMAYYTRQKLEDLSATELGRRVRAVQLVAEVQNLRGNNEDALPAFEQAARTTGELLARKPDDPERMFNHGQSLFWVGYIAWQHGKAGEARKAMEDYADISVRLAARDRSNLEWQMEEAYALSNLGTLDLEEGKLTNALDHFERSLARVDTVSEAEGRPVARQTELGEGQSWVATTLQYMGKIDEAVEAREAELDVYAALLKKEPDDNDVRRARQLALSALAQMSMYKGDVQRARELLDISIAEADAQIANDGDDTYAKELARGSLMYRAELAWSENDAGLTRQLHNRLERLMADLRRRDPNNYNWNIRDSAALDIQRALTDRQSITAAAKHSLATRWQGKLDRDEADSEWLLVASHFLTGLAFEQERKSDDARNAFLQAVQIPKVQGEYVDIRALMLRAVAALHAGDEQSASRLKSQLKELGVGAPIYGFQ